VNEGMTYERLELISRGSSREIWKAREKATGEIVALKIFPQPPDSENEDLGSLKLDWRSLKDLDHENIARIRDWGLTDAGKPFLVLDYIEGASLFQKIREKSDVPFSFWVDAILQTARGLRAAYHRNIIHRDIKPSNIMVTSGGLVKIVDFGLARVFRPSALLSLFKSRNPDFPADMVREYPARSPVEDILVGTPRYMAPEVCMGKVPDHRSDIYSLGATLYHCLAGRPPFDGETDADILHKQKSAPLESLYLVNPNIPESLSALVDRMMEKDPPGRFQDYDSLIEALEDAKLSCLSRERGAHDVHSPADRMIVHEQIPSTPVAPSRDMEQNLGSGRKMAFILAGVILVLAILALSLVQRQEKRVVSVRKILSLVITRLLEKEKLNQDHAQKIALTLENMRKISQAFQEFLSVNQASPQDINALINQGYLKKEDALDPWGEPLILDLDQNKIISPGPDRQKGTADDVQMPLASPPQKNL